MGRMWRWRMAAAGVVLGMSLAGHAKEAPEAEDALVADEETPAVSRKTKAKPKRKKGGAEGLVVKVDALRVEAGAFTDDPGARGNAWLNGSVSARWQPDPTWEVMLGARVDGYAHTGDLDYREGRLDYTENFVRWRGESTRVTLGTQNVLWGRVDEIPPVDRLSRVDLSRGMLDKLPERRRAVPALRLEHFAGDYKLDAVWLPVFDAAVLPEMDSVWHPVNRRSGRIIGIEDSPALSALVTAARFREDDDGSGGGGVRLTRSGGNVDWGFSLQRVRQSLPYYRYSAGAPPQFTAVHPYSWVVGGELELQRGGATWRLETAYSSDVPMTRRSDLGFTTDSAVDLVLGVEFFPGDADTRVTLQWSGHRAFNDASVLDRTRYHGFSGEIEHPFASGRWRANLRFYAGLDQRDVYVNPKLTYLGFEPHELSVGFHHFSGNDQTPSGFYSENDLVAVGWMTKF